jgi:hypothetical protein
MASRRPTAAATITEEKTKRPPRGAYVPRTRGLADRGEGVNSKKHVTSADWQASMCKMAPALSVAFGSRSNSKKACDECGLASVYVQNGTSSLRGL